MSAEQSKHTSRRNFLSSLVVGLNALTALLVAVPAVGYVFSPLLKRRQAQWVSLGPTAQFEGEEPQVVKFRLVDDTSFTERPQPHTVFVRRLGEDFLVLSSRCTHMGCNIAFNAAAGTFDCPCHGGRYDLSGQVIEGPPPQPLPRFRTRTTDGDLEIETV